MPSVDNQEVSEYKKELHYDIITFVNPSQARTAGRA